MFGGGLGCRFSKFQVSCGGQLSQRCNKLPVASEAVVVAVAKVIVFKRGQHPPLSLLLFLLFLYLFLSFFLCDLLPTFLVDLFQFGKFLCFFFSSYHLSGPAHYLGFCSQHLLVRFSDSAMFLRSYFNFAACFFGFWFLGILLCPYGAA